LQITTKKPYQHYFWMLRSIWSCLSQSIAKIMQDLHLPYILTKWVQLFLSDRTVSLTFDGEKNSDQKIKSEIPQGSPISPILFLIYIRFLFTQVKNNTQTHKSKYLVILMMWLWQLW
jgi:hypothetical protein